MSNFHAIVGTDGAGARATVWLALFLRGCSRRLVGNAEMTGPTCYLKDMRSKNGSKIYVSMPPDSPAQDKSIAPLKPEVLHSVRDKECIGHARRIRESRRSRFDCLIYVQSDICFGNVALQLRLARGAFVGCDRSAPIGF
jgi:hypothetical protein